MKAARVKRHGPSVPEREPSALVAQGRFRRRGLTATTIAISPGVMLSRSTGVRAACASRPL